MSAITWTITLPLLCKSRSGSRNRGNTLKQGKRTFYFFYPNLSLWTYAGYAVLNTRLGCSETIMTQISPNFSHEKLESASTDDFIDILEDRVVYWLLKPAKILLETPHGDIAAVSLLLSYFEAHAIYLVGQDSLGQSKRFFREGFVDVFTSPNHNRAFLQRVADFLYEQARCGFFHDGIFREKVLFRDDLPGEFFVTVPQRNGKPDEGGAIESVVINPRRFLNALVSHFANYISRLRDGAQTDARNNFRRSVEIKWSPATPGPIIGMDEEGFAKLGR